MIGGYVGKAIGAALRVAAEGSLFEYAGSSNIALAMTSPVVVVKDHVGTLDLTLAISSATDSVNVLTYAGSCDIAFGMISNVAEINDYVGSGNLSLAMTSPVVVVKVPQTTADIAFATASSVCRGKAYPASAADLTLTIASAIVAVKVPQVTADLALALTSTLLKIKDFVGSGDIEFGLISQGAREYVYSGAELELTLGIESTTLDIVVVGNYEGSCDIELEIDSPIAIYLWMLDDAVSSNWDTETAGSGSWTKDSGASSSWEKQPAFTE